MVRSLIARSTMLLREGRSNYKQIMLHHTLHHDELIHGVVVPNKDQNNNSSNNNNNNNKEDINKGGGAKYCTAESALWVPHPRTGIYYPKGYEWVMEDVPQGASSFPQPYWLRSSAEVVVEICRPTPTPTAAPAAAATSTSHSSTTDEIFDHPFLNDL